MAPARHGLATTSATQRVRRLDWWLIGALSVSVLAFVLGTIGIGYGLPYHYHWDEPTILNRAIRMGSGDLNPHFFTYPTFLMYVMLGAQGALFLVGRTLHIYGSSNAFLVSYLTDSTASYVVARTLVAAAGAATVLVTYLVGRRFISPAAGLVGALILTVTPVFVGNSHFATNDVPMAFLSTLSVLLLWNVYRRGSVRDYLLAGVVIGLAISTKYLPVLLLVSLGIAHVFRLRLSGQSLTISALSLKPLASAGAAFAAFALTSPYVLIDWSSALRDYGAQAQLSAATGCSGCSLNFVPYLTQTLGWAVGWPVYVLALIGLLSVPFQRGERRMRFILLASWPVLLFAVIGSERQAWPRYLVPLAPFLSLSAAAASLALYRRMAAFGPRMGAAFIPRYGTPAVAAVALGLVLVPAALSSLRYDSSLIQQDPRTAAVAWFAQNVPGGTKVAVQPLLGRYFLTAQLPTQSELALEESWIPAGRGDARALLDATYHAGPVYDDVAFVYDYDQLKAAGAQYVIISSAHYHAVDPAAEDRLYAQLRARARLMRTFWPSVQLPDAENFPVFAPVITVYELT